MLRASAAAEDAATLIFRYAARHHYYFHAAIDISIFSRLVSSFLISEICFFRGQFNVYIYFNRMS
jgi:hypothetical protein